MHKLPEVREAKDLMQEALDWSTLRWLLEKPRVRATADRANAALDKLERDVKGRWNHELKAVYKSLSRKRVHERQQDGDQPQSPGGDRQLIEDLETVLAADRAAERARADAEDTFDKAEEQMSVALAREGCRKAIHSWELHEKAIRKAHAVTHLAAPEEPLH